ncbi:adenylyltransferase/cytidyltransferase family protein [Corynebacterium sp. CCM 9203]|uniref:adenylyltransferase/cytidyltransferase family protein n=1 Tax=Corynebacterium sp. CCM 9203 TaxID=3057615 RepID=UPI00352505EF
MTSTSNTRPICVIGDVIEDVFISGHVSRTNPEAPCIVFDAKKTARQAGGVANSYTSLKTLYPNTYLCSAGSLINDNCFNGENHSNVFNFNQNYITPRKTRYSSGSSILLRVDEVHQDQDGLLDVKLKSRFQEILEQSEVLLVNDYGQNYVIPRFAAYISDFSDQRLGQLVWDYHASSETIPPSGALVKMNEEEYFSITADPRSSCFSDIDLIRTVRSRNWSGLLITRKGCPAYFVSTDSVSEITPGNLRLSLSSSIGAGDITTAMWAYYLLEQPPQEAANLAVQTTTLFLAVENSVISQLDVGRDSLRSLKDALRLGRRRVVLATGCFDMLHAGHIDLLKRARSFGDFLIVGLNSDSSIRKNKGNQRPILDQNVRKMMLESLSYVDLVVVFDEKTPCELVSEIVPDFFVKGDDYTADTLVEFDCLQKLGVKVEFLPRRIPQSTTKIIQKELDY